MFQVRAAQGRTPDSDVRPDANEPLGPALRTLYYRLLRIFSVSVQPLFVFDGINKPLIKRNKEIAPGGPSTLDMMFKQLLNHFGFPYHTAPGEAEAECALLQREGIVDAVLSEDVDTLMFGCGLTLRNWSSESSKGKVPTHINVYDAQVIKQGNSGLDPEGMILVALLSGGDYDTKGVAGFGAKVACQAARAGFGKSLCHISRTDSAGYAKWRETFNHELQTNESRYFKSKHKSLKIPENFPESEILRYYTNPTISSAHEVAKLRDELRLEGEIDIVGLRQFVAEAFGWRYKAGAKKFIRGLAPVLLVHKLRLQGDRWAYGYDDPSPAAMKEMELVRSICGKRTHFTTDTLPEIRVIYIPRDIVGLDLEAEEDVTCNDGLEGFTSLLEGDRVPASPSKRATPAYDPTQPERVWIARAIVKLGDPFKLEDYEESVRNPKKLVSQRDNGKQAAAMRVKSKEPKAGDGMPTGTMDRFVETIKLVSEAPTHGPSKASYISSQSPPL